MNNVSCVGSVFIKAKDVKFFIEWYEKHLGIEFGNNSYVDFKWINKDPDIPGHALFSIVKTIQLISILLKNQQ